MTQEDYLKEMLKRNLGEEEESWPRRKLPMMKEKPEDEEVKKPHPDQVRRAQKIAGELLWLSTRTRPDLMFVVSKVAAQVLHHLSWVEDSARQIWAYLVATKEEGLAYEAGEPGFEWSEDAGIQTYADASFSPGGAESHGCVVVMLRGGLLLWKSSRQSTVTLSTAEAELNELIEGLMVGESVAAIMEELEPASDSQAAINICLAEGGSWRTRHLRLRAAHAKQRFTRGDWTLRHTPGEGMLADIGTKILPVARFEAFKTGLGMQKRTIEEEEMRPRPPKEGKNEERLRPPKEEPMKMQEKKAPKVPEDLVRALQVVTLFATLSQGRAGDQDGSQGGDGRRSDQDGDMFMFAVVFAYTVIVVVLTLVFRWIWAQWNHGSQGPEDAPEVQRPQETEHRNDDPNPEEVGEVSSGRSDVEPPPSPPRLRRRSERGGSRAAGSSQAAGSNRRENDGGDPDPAQPTWRRPRLFITPTGVKYHFNEDCSGLRNARFVQQVFWCPQCRGADILHPNRQLYVRAAGYPVHTRFWAPCAEVNTRELEPCRVCVSNGWPNGGWNE
eukprot:Skav233514  [mRNA]  locus=scaffold1225:75521:77185:- [translate_table: standard]